MGEVTMQFQIDISKNVNKSTYVKRVKQSFDL